MITHLNDLGLTVSYSRVLQLENQLASALCEDFQNKGAVAPSQLRLLLFASGAFDNLDHNPTSTTAKGSFHGIGISLFQFPTALNTGDEQDNIRLLILEKRNHKLPGSFTTVPAVALKTANVSVPQQSNVSISTEEQLKGAFLEENNWLIHASELLEKGEVEKGNTVAWSAFHATKQNGTANTHNTLTQLLPLFYEKAATAAMVKHGMIVLCWDTEFLNPGQMPVMAFDAPLFALAKFVQWKWPDTHGEQKFIAMFGGLLIEIAMWTTYGDDGPTH